MPVPDAPMMPTSPSGTLLAKASGTPFIIAVPQSGPIRKRPSSLAYNFNSRSSSRLTLSLKTMVFKPFFRAFLASAAAYSPGTDIRTKFDPGAEFTADLILLGLHKEACSFSFCGSSRSSFATLSAADRNFLSRAFIAIMRSAPEADAASLVKRSASCRMFLFAGVPIISAASCTPSIP